LVPKHVREHLESLRAIIKHAKALEECFRRQHVPTPPLEWESPTAYFQKVVAWAERELKPQMPATKEACDRERLDRELGRRLMNDIGIGRLSAFDWFVGEHLAQIYKKHFGTPATIGRSTDGKADSPYIRFAVRSLADLGIKGPRGKPYAGESIIKAVSLVRQRGTRRLGKSI
jgi:hypothetical protein